MGMGRGDHEFLRVQSVAAIDCFEHFGVQAGGNGEQLRGDEREAMAAAVIEVEGARVEAGPITAGDASGEAVATHGEAGRRRFGRGAVFGWRGAINHPSITKDAPGIPSGHGKGALL